MEREDLGIATVMARKGVDAIVLGAAFDVTMPTGSFVAEGDGASLIGTGPGVWLALIDRPSAYWTETLATKLTGLASVSDQTSGYVVFRVSGSGARALLQRGAFIDLDPAVFIPGSAASTAIAHISVILWQVDLTPTFEVAVYRSFARSFREWIATTAASADLILP